jgi:hypothetical protein
VSIQPLPEKPNARSARIQEAWDRATAVGLLGALFIAAESLPHTPLVVDAAAEDLSPGDPAPSKPIAVAEAAPASPPDPNAANSPDASAAPARPRNHPKRSCAREGNRGREACVPRP